MNKSKIRIFIRHFSTSYKNRHEPSFWWDFYLKSNFNFLGFAKELENKTIEAKYYE